MSRPSEAWRDAEWAGDDLDNRADDATSPYRVLLAMILATAANDLRTRSRDDCLDAYKWVAGLDAHRQWFAYICESLGLRTQWVQEQLVPPARDRCERWLREDAAERARVRRERDEAEDAIRRAAAAKRAEQEALLAQRLERAKLKQQKVRSAWRTQQRKEAHRGRP